MTRTRSGDAAGRLIVLSGPSGCGKSTVVHHLLACDDLPLALSVSATTRAPRPTDVDGRTYHFMTGRQFDEARRRGEFLECANVHGNWYGTPRSEVEDRLREGKWVLLEIDVQGALAIKKAFPDSTSIFLEAPSLEDYQRRLRDRGADSEEVIQRRVAGARAELALADQYDHRVVNRRNKLHEAVEEIRQILLRRQRREPCSMR